MDSGLIPEFTQIKNHCDIHCRPIYGTVSSGNLCFPRKLNRRLGVYHYNYLYIFVNHYLEILLKNIGKILTLLSLPLQVLLLRMVADRPLWVEHFYTGAVYKYLSQGLRFAFGGLSLPLGQLLFYSLIAGVLVWIGGLVKMRLKKKIGRKQFALDFAFGAIAIVSGFYFLFNSMWGLNYYRQPIQEIVKLDTKVFSTTELEAMSARLIELTNQSRSRLTPDNYNPLLYPLSHEQILAQAPEGYRPLAQKYPALLYSQQSVKSVFVPELMSYFGLAGIYFPFTGEANINMDPPPYMLPETVCHEMAHQIGFASEDEANFVSYLACELSPEPAFQYSGNLMAMRYTLNRLYWEDSTTYYRQIQNLSPGVKCDLEVTRNYWNGFENPIEVAGRVINDLFLKSNNQTEGVRSYNRVVELLMGEYRKNGLVYEQSQKQVFVSQK